MNSNINNKLPVWNLKDLYSGLKDEKIKKDFEKLEKNLSKFNEKYKNQITKLDSKELYNCIVEYEDINELIGKLASFASLKYAEDLSITENVSFYQEIIEKITTLSKDLVFFTIEINKINNTNLKNKILGYPPLIKKYSEFLRVIRLKKKYQLNEDLEQLFIDKSVTSGIAWSRLFDETMDNMIFTFENKKYNSGQILEIINNDKYEKVRKAAGKVFGEKLGENIKLFSFIINTLAKDKSISDEWRGFKNSIAERNLSNLIEDEVVENLYNSVQNNYENISHRYYKLKAKLLNKTKLHYTDRNAPLPFNSNKKYSWGEAKKIVLDAYYEFSPKMAEIGQLFFDNNWIDAQVRQGKKGGAFMQPTVPSVHPYILLSFQGTERDVMTLAHELGHGIHYYLSKNVGYLNYDMPLTIAETASVFGEQLVFRSLLKKEKNDINKAVILANKIEDMINTVVRQIAFLEFEKIVHNERKNGEISSDKLNDIWMSIQQKSLGSIFEYTEEYKYYWAYISHFIHSPFYVYSYAFGDCLVNSLYSQYLQSPNGFEKKYLELLKSGSTAVYTELLKPFDLDPKNEDFWNNGMKVIINLIDELEQLLKTCDLSKK